MAFRIVSSGHIALASVFKSSKDLWVARGTLPDEYPGLWGATDVPPESLSRVVLNEIVSKGVEGSTDIFANNPVLDVYEVSQGDNRWIRDENFTIVPTGIKWSESSDQPTTSSSYTVSYRYYTDMVYSIASEVDRMRVMSMSFVKKDDNGSIETDGFRWSVSEEPTKYLYCDVKFPSNASLGSTIYQAGLYIGTALKDGVDPDGVIKPEDMESEGTLYMVNNIRPFYQGNTVRQGFEIVIEF